MRIAIYFAPAPDSPWARFGLRWLGRDTGASASPPSPPSDAPGPGGDEPPAWPELGWGADERRRMAVEPRRYGFHATLVAPFRLAAGARIEDVSDAARRFAEQRRAVLGVPLRVSRQSGFVALRPAGPEPAIDALAFDAVRRFDAFRAPLETAERERRAAGLDAHGRALLDRWGYAQVADRFCFHLSLTDALDPPELERAADTARRVLAREALGAIDVDGIALFVEGEDRRFRMVQRHRLPRP